MEVRGGQIQAAGALSRASAAFARLELQSIISNRTTRNQAPRVAQILEEFPTLAQEWDRNGFLPLHTAMQSRARFEVLRALVSSYPHALAFKGGVDRETPVDIACRISGEGSATPHQFLVMIAKQAASSHDHLDVALPEIQPLFGDCDPWIASYICYDTIRSCDEVGRSVLHRICRRPPDASTAELVRWLVQARPQSVFEKATSGYAPLHYAVTYANEHSFSVFQALLHVSTQSVEVDNKAGCIAFALHLLVDPEVDPNLVRPTRIAKLLCQYCPECTTAVNFDDQTAMHLVCEAAEDYMDQGLALALIKVMEENNPAVLSIRDRYGATPLQALCIGREALTDVLPTKGIQYLVEACLRHGFVNVVGNALLGVCNAHFNSAELKHEVIGLLAVSEEVISSGFTPTALHLLALMGQLARESFTLLFQRCPALLATTDDHGRTALHLVCEAAGDYNDQSLALALIRDMVENNPAVLIIRDRGGTTPLQALCYGREELSDVNPAEAIQHLVETCLGMDGGVSVVGNALLGVCNTYFNSAGLKNGVINLLAVSEAVVSARDELGRTALHLLAQSGDVTPDIYNLLVQRCPDLATLTDNHGRTALHLAVLGSATASSPTKMLQYIDTLRVLLSQSPDSIDRHDNGRATPLMLACAQDVDLNIIYELMRFDPGRLMQQ